VFASGTGSRGFDEVSPSECLSVLKAAAKKLIHITGAGLGETFSYDSHDPRGARASLMAWRANYIEQKTLQSPLGRARNKRLADWAFRRQLSGRQGQIGRNRKEHLQELCAAQTDLVISRESDKRTKAATSRTSHGSSN